MSGNVGDGAEALREVARLCARRYRDPRKDQGPVGVVRELFQRAGAEELLRKETNAACALDRFRRRKQRRSSGQEGGASAPPRAAAELLLPLSEELTCPITMSRPVEPVLLADGNVYERRAIEAWLSKSLTSPLTRERLQPRPWVPWPRVGEALARHGSLRPPPAASVGSPTLDGPEESQRGA